MKNIWTWVVIAVVVIGGIWLLSGNNTEQTTPSETESDTEEVGSASDIQGAFMGSGSVRCEYTDSENGATGVAFIKSGNVRVNATMTTGGTAHVIYKGDTAYMWLDGQAQGFMMSTADIQAAGSQAQVSSKADFQKQMEGKQATCKPATVSDSEFSPPSTVEFKSFSQMMVR